MIERILVVAPSWVGDAILSEPLIALVREPYEEPIVDVLAPPWCSAVYARIRGIRQVIESPLAHGRLDLPARRALAHQLKASGYSRAIVLPNSWKSALVPWLARIPRRTGYVGEFRYGLLTDARRLDRKALPRLVDRFAALAAPPGTLIPMPPAPVLVPDLANRNAAARAMHLRTDRPDRRAVPRRRVRTGETLAADAFRGPRRAFPRPGSSGVAGRARRTTSSPPRR